MDFVFCTDKNYLRGYGVLMLSILRFTPPHTPTAERLRFHVLSDDLDNADKATLQGIASRRKNTEVAFYSPAQALSKEVVRQIDATMHRAPAHSYVTKETYYRVLAANILPPDVHRALYLDGDMVCTGSLEELFTADMKGCPAGMCYGTAPFAVPVHNRLDYPTSEGYFNAGFILFDLDLWRKENLTKSMLDYLEVNSKKLLSLDQDLINAVLHGRILRMDFSYNVNPKCFYVFYWILEGENKYYAEQTQYLQKAEWPDLLAACESPRIVHFTTALKPWYRECGVPFTSVWRYFYAHSPWANEPLKHISTKARIKRIGRKVLERFKVLAPRIPTPKEAYTSEQRVLVRLREEDGA